MENLLKMSFIFLICILCLSCSSGRHKTSVGKISTEPSTTLASPTVSQSKPEADITRQASAIATGFDFPATNYRYTQQFNQYWSGMNPHFHLGEDVVPSVYKAYAMAEGIVRYRTALGGGWGTPGYVVILEHTLPGNIKVNTLYGHLTSLNPALPAANSATPVIKGFWIGNGFNGGSGPHLHYETRWGTLGNYNAGPGWTYELAKGILGPQLQFDPTDFIGNNRNFSNSENHGGVVIFNDKFDPNWHWGTKTFDNKWEKRNGQSFIGYDVSGPGKWWASTAYGDNSSGCLRFSLSANGTTQSQSGYGDNEGGSYSSTSGDVAESYPIWVPAGTSNLYLTFKEKYSIASGDYCSIDIVYGSNIITNVIPSYNGSSGSNWVGRVIPLSAATAVGSNGGYIKLRFRFRSDGTNCTANDASLIGWMIDNIRLVANPTTIPTVSQGDAYEPDNTSSTSKTLTPTTTTQSQSRSIRPAGDQDWCNFYATQGRTYTFYSTSIIDNYIELYNSSLTRIDYDDDDGDEYNFLLTWTAPSTGTYYIKMRGYNNSTTIGDYTFYYYCNQPSISPPAPSSITATDGIYPDKIKVEWGASSGHTGYRLYRSTNSTCPSTPYQNNIPANYYYYDDTSVTPGTLYYYWISAYNSYGESNKSGPDSGFTQSQLDAYEPDNVYNIAKWIYPYPTLLSQSRSIRPTGDQDWCVFTANQGYKYTFYSTSIIDTYIELYDSSLTMIAYNDDEGDGNNFLLTWIAPSTGTYYIKMRGYSTSTTGDYTFYYKYQQPQLQYQNYFSDLVNNPYDNVGWEIWNSSGPTWWYISTPGANGGPYSWRLGNTNGTGYGNNENDTLTSPSIKIPANSPNVYFYFLTRFQLETNFDYLRVYYSTDNGSSWSQLQSFNGYNPGNPSWTSYSYTLPSNNTSSDKYYRIKYNMTSNGSVTLLGPQIDDINVYGYTLAY